MRVYDCRHAAATTWLRSGDPRGEPARRLGHSVETLVSTYVGALQDDETIGNAKIESFLNEQTPEHVGSHRIQPIGAGLLVPADSRPNAKSDQLL